MSKRLRVIILVSIIVILIGAGIWYWVDQRASTNEQAGGMCGGIKGLKCPQYYVCYMPENAPSDAFGQCIPQYVDYSINSK